MAVDSKNNTKHYSLHIQRVCRSGDRSQARNEVTVLLSVGIGNYARVGVAPPAVVVDFTRRIPRTTTGFLTGIFENQL